MDLSPELHRIGQRLTTCRDYRSYMLLTMYICARGRSQLGTYLQCMYLDNMIPMWVK